MFDTPAYFPFFQSFCPVTFSFSYSSVPSSAENFSCRYDGGEVSLNAAADVKMQKDSGGRRACGVAMHRASLQGRFVLG